MKQEATHQSKKDSNIKCRSFRLAKMWKTYEKYTILNLFSIAVFVVDFTANYSEWLSPD